MTQNKFDGDVSELSPKQIEYITNVLNDRGFSGSKVTIKPVGEVGDNYVASVKRIIAEKGEESLKIIAKVAPRIEQLRATMNTRMMFLNEHVMYTEVLPKFTELEKAAGISANEQLKYATCYGTVIDECDELILLEDLTDSGFVMLNRFQSLTDNDVRLILKTFARIHSLSYALKYKDPETYRSFENKVLNFWKMFSVERAELTRPYFDMVENDCLALCDQKYSNHIRGSLSRLPELAKKINDFDDHSRFSVITQGDSWTNNILFHLEDGKSVSCCMIDYQVSRVNSPVSDLLYMIFNCTDHQTRKQHFSDWIDYYHSELDKSLFEFGLKANFVYPRDQLDADLKRNGKMSFATAILLAATLSRETAAAQELKSAMENFNEADMTKLANATRIKNVDEKTISTFKYRVEGIIETCMQYGIL